MGRGFGGQHALLDHLIRPQEDRLRDREPKGLRGLQVDHELEFGGLLDGKVGGLGALQDLVHVKGGAPKQLGKARPIGHEAPATALCGTWYIAGSRLFATKSMIRPT